MRRTTQDCLTFTIGAISAIGMAVRHISGNVGPILKDTRHFDRRIAKRYFKACVCSSFQKKNASKFQLTNKFDGIELY